MAGTTKARSPHLTMITEETNAAITKASAWAKGSSAANSARSSATRTRKRRSSCCQMAEAATR
jgi:hypothetical protein